MSMNRLDKFLNCRLNTDANPNFILGFLTTYCFRQPYLFLLCVTIPYHSFNCCFSHIITSYTGKQERDFIGMFDFIVPQYINQKTLYHMLGCLNRLFRVPRAYKSDRFAVTMIVGIINGFNNKKFFLL